MNIEFKEIPAANKGGKDQDIFELFACDFLESLGYEIIQRPSRGPDGKKDLIVQSNPVPGTTSDSKTKWLVSCKHNAHSGKGVSDTDEPDITDRLNKHKCHGFLGFYSTIPNSTLSDKLVSLNDRFVATVYDHSRIEKEIHSLKEKERILATYFPKSKEKLTVEQLSKNDFEPNEIKENKELTFNNKQQQQFNQLLEVARTAIIQIEIAKLKFEFSNDWNKNKRIFDQLQTYVDFRNEILANDIFAFLNIHISTATRSNMPPTIACAIHSLVLTYFPSSYREEEQNLKLENGKQCIYTGFNMIYDSFIYTNNFRVAQWGLNIWKFVYRESKRNNYTELVELVLMQYDELESNLNRPERNDLKNAKELLQIFKEDLNTYNLAFPPLPDHLYVLTLKSDKI